MTINQLLCSYFGLWPYEYCRIGLSLVTTLMCLSVVKLLTFLLKTNNLATTGWLCSSSSFTTYCVGGSKCNALPLYTVKQTKARAILISPRMWLGQYDFAWPLLHHKLLCHRSYVQSNIYVCMNTLDGCYLCDD